jgi:hypothetical protein
MAGGARHDWLARHPASLDSIHSTQTSKNPGGRVDAWQTATGFRFSNEIDVQGT